MNKIKIPTTKPYPINICKEKFPIPAYSTNIDDMLSKFTLSHINSHCSYINDNLVTVLKNENGASAVINLNTNVNNGNNNWIKSIFDKSIEKLSDLGQNIFGFMVGGIKAGNTDLSKMSCDMYNTAASYFNENNIPVAMICGKDIDSDPYMLKTYCRNIYLYNNGIRGLNKDMSHDEIIKELLKNHDIVEFPSTIKINFLEKDEMDKRSKAQKLSI
ncbi:hypothetical protein IJO12_09320 [bacterium]|nr:hypothetical protein [bacterium]